MQGNCSAKYNWNLAWIGSLDKIHQYFGWGRVWILGPCFYFFAVLLSPVLDGFDQLLSSLHCPLSKQCALSINLYDIKIWKNLGNAENRTWGRWVRSKYAIHCAMRPPPQICEAFVWLFFWPLSTSSLQPWRTSRTWSAGSRAPSRTSPPTTAAKIVSAEVVCPPRKKSRPRRKRGSRKGLNNFLVAHVVDRQSEPVTQGSGTWCQARIHRSFRLLFFHWKNLVIWW